MPQREIAEVLLDADETVISIKQIQERLETHRSKGSISNEIQRIAETVDANYSEWRYREGNYATGEVQEYQERLEEEYSLRGSPEPVREELDRLGVLKN